jgi:hypothetical protein
MAKVTTVLLIILLPLLLAPAAGLAQSNDLARADRWYKDKAYRKAIPLYEEALRRKFRLGAAQKLAQAYRLTNQWEKAEALLDSTVRQDKVKEEMFFLYGEALMSNGKYGQAREWFLRAAEAGDSLARQRAEACLVVEDIEPLFPGVSYRALPFNSESDDHAVMPWQGGLVFTSDRSPGLRLLQEKSDWTGRHYLSLFFTRPNGDSTWTSPELWSGRLNVQNLNAGYAVIAPDSQAVWFTRNSPSANDRGVYPLQIYMARRIGEDRWSRPEPASFAKQSFNMMHPAISPDGQWMAFSSDRPGGEGGLDLWLVRRQGDGWARPYNPGPPLNTSAHDGFPFFAADGRLFFASKGHMGYGGYDLFVSERLENGDWSKPRNLGRPINSPLDDITFYLGPDGKGGYFSSTRDGGDDDLYEWHCTE